MKILKLDNSIRNFDLVIELIKFNIYKELLSRVTQTRITRTGGSKLIPTIEYVYRVCGYRTYNYQTLYIVPMTLAQNLA